MSTSTKFSLKSSTIARLTTPCRRSTARCRAQGHRRIDTGRRHPCRGAHAGKGGEKIEGKADRMKRGASYSIAHKVSYIWCVQNRAPYMPQDWIQSSIWRRRCLLSAQEIRGGATRNFEAGQRCDSRRARHLRIAGHLQTPGSQRQTSERRGRARITMFHQELLAPRSRNSFVVVVMTLARELLLAVTKRIGS